jgi:hypothetical protein
MGFPRRIDRVMVIGLVALWSPAAPGASPPPPDDGRQQLRAEIEGLLAAVALRVDATRPDPLLATTAGVHVAAQPAEERSLAGIQITRTPVTLQGEPGALLAWLSAARRARRVPTPPFKLTTEADRPRLEISVWSAQGLSADKTADLTTLTNARDNLDWLSRQRKAARPLHRLLETLVDFETVRVDRAELQANSLALSGIAQDSISRDTFLRALQLRAGELPGRVRWSADELKALAPPPGSPNASFVLSGLDLHEALHLLAVAGSFNLVLLAPGDRLPVSTGFSTAAPKELALQLAERFSLKHRWIGNTLVVASSLAGDPSPPAEIVRTPMTLDIVRAAPEKILGLLGEVSNLSGVMPFKGTRRLTVLARALPAGELAGMVLWAHGLSRRSCGHLVIIQDQAARPEPAGRCRAGDTDLMVERVPLPEVIAGLAGLDDVASCEPLPQEITLHLKKINAQDLLETLLAVHALVLTRSTPQKPVEFLEAAREPGAAPRPCDPARYPAAASPSADRLAGTLLSDTGNRALLAIGGGWRWFKEGDTLPDGRQLKKVAPARIVLRNQAGAVIHLRVERPQPAGVPVASDPVTELLGLPLSKIRLAATATFGRQELAAVETASGRMLVVRPGTPVGRRCGNITSIHPASLQVTLHCPGPDEPKEVTIPVQSDWHLPDPPKTEK